MYIAGTQDSGHYEVAPLPALKKRHADALSPEAKRLRAKLTRAYAIEDEAGELVLNTALEAFDRMRAAQKVIATEGMTFTDRYKQPRAHPLLVTERDSRAAFMAGIKALGLDLEPLHDGPGRPAGSVNWVRGD